MSEEVFKKLQEDLLKTIDIYKDYAMWKSEDVKAIDRIEKEFTEIAFKQLHNEEGNLDSREYDLLAKEIGKLSNQIREEYTSPIGRPSLGLTKKISLTLAEDLWKKIDELKEENDESQSAILRGIIERDLTPYNYKPDEKLFKEFKNYVLNAQKPLIYHFYRHGMIIRTEIVTVEPLHEDAGIKFSFKDGTIDFWAKSKLLKVSRPSMLLTNCEACYSLYNEYGEQIGYIYTTRGAE